MRARQYLVLVHRYVGLLLAVPLIVVALTGSIIAFTTELNRWMSPERYATAPPGAQRLDFETLAVRAQDLVSLHDTIVSVSDSRDRVTVRVNTPVDAAATAGVTGRSQPFYLLYLDPWTGRELARQVSPRGEPVRPNKVMPFIHALHDDLAMGLLGRWALGVIALLWTVDCFVAWYLTLPNAPKNFWRRWKTAWLINGQASTFRLWFDLHRAPGLWLWPLLLVFAWSSVALNLPGVYDPVTRALVGYRSPTEQRAQQASQQQRSMQKYRVAPGEPQPDLVAIALMAKRLAAEQAPRRGFSDLPRVASVARRPGSQVINATLRSNEERCQDLDEIRSDTHKTRCAALMAFDGTTGEVTDWQEVPRSRADEPAGNGITFWLRVLHFGQMLGRAYQVFVSLAGLVIAVLAATGIYLWWKKRGFRKYAAAMKSRGIQAAS